MDAAKGSDKMLKLLQSARFLLAALFCGERHMPDPDTMSLREWADLPPHHPRCKQTPC